MSPRLFKSAVAMPQTHGLRETVQACARINAGFRRGLLEEAVESFLSGDIGTGKILLCDYINATIGFERLAAELDRKPKSLMRMLGPLGNPRAANLFAIVAHLKLLEGIVFVGKSARRVA